MATQTPAQTRARQAAAAGAVGAGVAARGAAGAGSGAAAAGGVGAGVAAAGILSGLVAFLASLRQRNREALASELGRYSTQPTDIAAAMAQEDALELAFARASADRVASKLPQALRIDDPRERERQVRQILSDEERFARQRSEAMFARAIAAVTRADLRVSSPLGAFWRIGVAQDHTPGCRFMAGWPGLPGRFWPWVVLDRVHPPRHYGCSSSLHGYGDAIVNGWMTPGQVPDTRDAIAQAAGVVMEKDEAGALLAELDLRDRLVESGVSPDALSVIPFAGVREAFDAGEHPRDWRGRWRRKLGGPRLTLKGEKRLTERQVHAAVGKVANGLVDFYGGERVPIAHEPEYLASVGSDARFRHAGEPLAGINYGQRIMERARDPELGVEELRIIAHEAAHSLSGTRPGPTPGFSQQFEEGGAEVLSLWFWHHKMQQFDARDATKVPGGWTKGLDSLAHSVAYREWTEGLLRRAASRVGWDRHALIDEVQRVLRGDHTERLKFRDASDPNFPLPADLPQMPRSPGRADETDNAVALIRWLVESKGV